MLERQDPKLFFLSATPRDVFLIDSHHSIDSSKDTNVDNQDIENVADRALFFHDVLHTSNDRQDTVFLCIILKRFNIVLVSSLTQAKI